MVFEYPKAALNGTALLLFYASYNSKCIPTLEQFNKISIEYPNIQFITINTTNHYDLKQSFQIHSVPSYIGIKNGQIKFKLNGNQNYIVLNNYLKEL